MKDFKQKNGLPPSCCAPATLASLWCTDRGGRESADGPARESREQSGQGGFLPRAGKDSRGRHGQAKAGLSGGDGLSVVSVGSTSPRRESELADTHSAGRMQAVSQGERERDQEVWVCLV